MYTADEPRSLYAMASRSFRMFRGTASSWTVWPRECPDIAGDSRFDGVLFSPFTIIPSGEHRYGSRAG